MSVGIVSPGGPAAKSAVAAGPGDQSFEPQPQWLAPNGDVGPQLQGSQPHGSQPQPGFLRSSFMASSK